MIRHGGGPRGGVARSVKKMRGYLAELIHRKRDATPGDDLISGLIRASDHGEHLTENEAAAMAFILLFAGFETTVNLIGNGMYALLTHPGQRARLQASLAAGETRPAGDRRRGTPALRRPGRARHLAFRHRAADPRRAAHRGRRPRPRGPGRRRPRPGAVRRPGHAGPLPRATTSTSATATASTTASAPRSPGWRARPRSPPCSPACRTCGSPRIRPSCAGAAGSSCVGCARCRWSSHRVAPAERDGPSDL